MGTSESIGFSTVAGFFAGEGGNFDTYTEAALTDSQRKDIDKNSFSADLISTKALTDIVTDLLEDVAARVRQVSSAATQQAKQSYNLGSERLITRGDAFSSRNGGMPKTSAPNWLSPATQLTGLSKTDLTQAIQMAVVSLSQAEIDKATSQLSTILAGKGTAKLGVPSSQFSSTYDRSIATTVLGNMGIDRVIENVLAGVPEVSKFFSVGDIARNAGDLWFSGGEGLDLGLFRGSKGGAAFQGASGAVSGSLQVAGFIADAVAAKDGALRGMAIASAALSGVAAVAAFIPVVGWIVALAASIALAALKIAAFFRGQNIKKKSDGRKNYVKDAVASWKVLPKSYSALIESQENALLFSYPSALAENIENLFYPPDFDEARKLYRDMSDAGEDEVVPVADGVFFDTSVASMGFIPSLGMCASLLTTGTYEIVYGGSGGKFAVSRTAAAANPVLGGKMMTTLNKACAQSYSSIMGGDPALLARIDTAHVTQAWWEWIAAALDYTINPQLSYVNWLVQPEWSYFLSEGRPQSFADYRKSESTGLFWPAYGSNYQDVDYTKYEGGKGADHKLRYQDMAPGALGKLFGREDKYLPTIESNRKKGRPLYSKEDFIFKAITEARNNNSGLRWNGDGTFTGAYLGATETRQTGESQRWMWNAGNYITADGDLGPVAINKTGITQAGKITKAQVFRDPDDALFDSIAGQVVIPLIQLLWPDYAPGNPAYSQSPLRSLTSGSFLASKNYAMRNVVGGDIDKFLGQAASGMWGTPAPVKDMQDIAKAQAALFETTEEGLPRGGISLFGIDPYHPVCVGVAQFKAAWEKGVNQLVAVPGIEDKVVLADVANPKLRQQMRQLKVNGARKFRETLDSPKDKTFALPLANKYTAALGKPFVPPVLSTNNVVPPVGFAGGVATATTDGGQPMPKWAGPAMLSSAVAGTVMMLYTATRYHRRR